MGIYNSTNNNISTIKIYPLLPIRFSLDGDAFVLKEKKILIYYNGTLTLIDIHLSRTDFLLKLNTPRCIPLRDFYYQKVFLYIPDGEEICHLPYRDNFLGIISESHEILMKFRDRTKKWKVYYKGTFSVHPEVDGIINENIKIIDKSHGRLIKSEKEDTEKIEILI